MLIIPLALLWWWWLFFVFAQVGITRIWASGKEGPLDASLCQGPEEAGLHVCPCERSCHLFI